MAAITIGGVDLEATLGFQFTDDGNYLDAAVTIPGEVEIPNVPGALSAGPNRVPVREFTLRGYLNGSTRAAVRTNLHLLRALVGSADVAVILGGWSTVTITARCVKFEASDGVGPTRANAQNEVPVRVAMTFRAASPYWEDITPQSVGFTTSAVAMPQGTAPSNPVLTTTAAVATTPTITCKDYLGATLWTATLASLGATERYRITTAPGVMTIEKYNGSAWVNSDASLTSGTFPKPLPSSGVGYQTAAWPTLQATSGTWTAAYSKAWL